MLSSRRGGERRNGPIRPRPRRDRPRFATPSRPRPRRSAGRLREGPGLVTPARGPSPWCSPGCSTSRVDKRPSFARPEYRRSVRGCCYSPPDRVQPLVDHRSDDDVLVGRAIAPDAADVLDHPLIDGAEGVMGERVHARVLEALLGRPAVPALPDAGRPLLDREAPGGERVVVQQPIRHVLAADLATARASATWCR